MAKGFAALILFVALAFAPAAAHGATVKLVFDGTTSETGEAAGLSQFHVEFVAEDGEANKLTASSDPYSMILHDDGAELEPGVGCTQGVTDNDVTCKPAPQGVVSGSTFDLGDGNDSATLSQYWETPLIRVQGRAGNDTVNGPVVFDGGTGADGLSGAAGKPVAYMDYSNRTEPVNVSLDGNANDGAAGEGDFAGPLVGHVEGGAGDDVITSDDRDAFLVGNGGNDQLTGAGGKDALFGKEGNDTLRGGPGFDTLYGEGGDDSIDAGPVGSESALQIPQNGGELNGGEGNDVMTGNALGERLTGGNGDDSIDAGDGPDVIDDGFGRDRVLAGPGDDALKAGPGSDSYGGGDGFDSLDYSERTSDLHVSLDDVADDGEAGEGDNARSDVENLGGGRGSDVLTGSAAANVISGGVTGTDAIDGRDGADVLFGTGGATVTGGTGADAFYVRRGDRVRARDGAIDSISCGIDRPDDMQVDGFDKFTACASAVRLSTRTRIDSRSRIPITVACRATAQTCRGSFRVVLSNGDVIGLGSYVVRAGRSVKVQVKVSARTRGRLRSARKSTKATIQLLREASSVREPKALTVLPRARR